MKNVLHFPMEMESFDCMEDDFESSMAFEDDAFWNELKSWAGRTLRRIRTPGTPERKWTIGIGKGLMTGGSGLIGFGLAGPPGGIIGSALGGTIAHGIYPDRYMDEDSFMLEELGELAAETECDEDAVAYIRAMIPIVIRSVGGPRASLLGNAPVMMNVSRGITRTLRSSRATRPMVRLLPAIMHHSLKKLRHRAIHGKKVTPSITYKVLTSQAKRIYRSPKRSAKLLGRNYALCKYYRRLKRKASGGRRSFASKPILRTRYATA